MKRYVVMPVKVPKPWQIAGRALVVLMAALSVTLGYMWLIADRSPPRSDLPMTLFSLLNFVAGSFLLMPCFLGYYPSWMVRIVGRERLQKIVDQCRGLSGMQRENRAALKFPENWFSDSRVMGLLIVISLFFVGLMLSIRPGT